MGQFQKKYLKYNELRKEQHLNAKQAVLQNANRAAE